MRRSRIIYWILCMILALGLINGENFVKEKILKEKESIYVYAPDDMEDAFKRALKQAGMKGDYKIVMTDDKEIANIIVGNDNALYPNSTMSFSFAFSPFVIAYEDDSDYTKKLEESGVLTEAFFDKDYHEIDVSKVIEEASGEGKWSNLGLEESMGNIKVYYPHKETSYWNDFYNFMLVNVNGGKYPETEEQMKAAIKQVEIFENSDYTEAVQDFNEKIIRNGGFQANSFFFIPEKIAIDFADKNNSSVRLFYPLTTTYFYYYMAVDEIGNKLTPYFDEESNFGNFYTYIANEYYRSHEVPEISVGLTYVYEERNAYNVVNLDFKRLKPSDVELSE